MEKSAPRVAYSDTQKWLTEMEAATALDDLAHAWELFLIYHQRVWNKSEAHYKGKPFWGGIKSKYSARRNQDLVLRYVQQARHADEHGVELISEVANPQTRVMGPGIVMPGSSFTGGGDFNLASGSTVRVVIDPATIIARDVTNRGTSFSAPVVSGNARPHSVAIAQHAILFYDDLFRDIDAAGGD
jgi:hypothetical protein